MDQHCPQGNRLANSTIVKSQGSVIKDLRTEKPKTRGPESLSGPQRSMSDLQRSNESFKKARKEKKKEQRQQD